MPASQSLVTMGSIAASAEFELGEMIRAQFPDPAAALALLCTLVNLGQQGAAEDALTLAGEALFVTNDEMAEAIDAMSSR